MRGSDSARPPSPSPTLPPWAASLMFAAAAVAWWRERPVIKRNRESRLTEAERALRDSEERFRDVAEIVYDWIWESGPDHRFTWMSPRVEQAVGVPPSFFIGRSREEIGVPERDPAVWRRFRDGLNAHLPVRDIQFAWKCPDGRIAHLRINGKPRFGPDGAFLGYRGTGRDVTDLVEARREAVRIEDRFLAALDNVPDSVALFDDEERFVFGNKSYRDSLGDAARHLVPGIAFEQLLRKRLEHGRVPEEASGREAEWCAERLARFRDPSSPSEKKYFGRWVRVRDVPVPDGGTFVIVSDITDLKRREEELRESDSRFRDFADAASDVIWELDSELRDIYVSDRYFELIDDSPDDIIGNRRAELVPGYPDDNWARHLIVLENREPFRDFVFSRARTDGKILWFSSSGVPVFGRAGEFEGYRGTLKDITAEVEARKALRESEQRYRALVQSSPESIRVHCDGRIVFANPAFVKLMGARDEQEILTMDSLDMVHPDDRESIMRRRRQVLRSSEPLPPYQHRMRTLDRRTVHFETVAAQVRWQGRPAYVVIGRDITEHRQREEQLRQAQKMEAVGQLTGGVAHDFNNLLSVILGNLELLDEKLDPDGELTGLVTPAIKAANRGAALTHRLLAFSRKQSLAPKVTDLGELASGMTELLRRTLGETIEVDVVGDHDLWRCEVDHAQLEASLLNLAINARDAMPGGGRLTIETRNVARHEIGADVGADVGIAPGDYVMLAVTDTGSGMTAEIAARAFDPFFSTKDVGKGSGLGLSMVYGFVKQSGGHTELDSVEGEGSRFRIYLPRVRVVGFPAADTDTDAADTDTPDTVAEMPSRGETVLVVEDDADVRSLTVAQLAGMGYAVIEAPDADEAMSFLGSTDRIDLLLTDVVLPGVMSGMELAVEARRRRPDVKVLYMSGYAEDVLARDDESNDGIELLQKPFRKVDLAQKLLSALHGTAVEDGAIEDR